MLRSTLLVSKKVFASRTIRCNSDMVKIAAGVEFNTIAREWRLKWSGAQDKKSLAAVQVALDKHLNSIRKVDGVKSVQRIVCGGCLDYKVIVALPIAQFKAWELAKFAPEEQFLADVKAIPDVTTVETQTYTLMPVLWFDFSVCVQYLESWILCVVYYCQWLIKQTAAYRYLFFGFLYRILFTIKPDKKNADIKRQTRTTNGNNNTWGKTTKQNDKKCQYLAGHNNITSALLLGQLHYRIS